MADACIVCLGDLNNADSVTAELVALSEQQSSSSISKVDIESHPEAIAHLLPCGHELHNECLKPWVERANSCPICRQSFNMVELKANFQGLTITSYAVQDKQQVAEVDPSMIVEEDFSDDDIIVEPCLVCKSSQDESALLLCDGCDASCHTYCAGLDGVPAGAWFCDSCLQDGTNQLSLFGRGRQHNRGPHGRTVSVRDYSPSAANTWARVWQSVWDQLNLDLDFPFDEDAEGDVGSDARRREIEGWQQRFRVAQRQGGAARFRDTATALLNLRSDRTRRQSTPKESQEELRAWNAFEKARELQQSNQSSSSGRNKRKSPMASPVEPQTDPEPQTDQEPERTLKRPRTRRTQDFNETQRNSFPESSRSGRAAEAPNTADMQNPGPSFLTSLLQEVETGPAEKSLQIQTSGVVPSNFTDYSSPDSLSPASSPSTSNHPSPRVRSISPPPFYGPRAQSPPPLTSRIEPIFAQLPEYSPASPSIRGRSDNEEPNANVQTRHRSQPTAEDKAQHTKVQSSRDDSPSRSNLTYSAKENIQKMVSSELKPHYRSREIDTDQYTEINRQVSRLLYDRIGEAGGVKDERDRDKWQSVAKREVERALKAVKPKEITARPS